MTLPVFYYAQGTTFTWNGLGFTVSADGSGLVFGSPFGEPKTINLNIKGLDGNNYFWAGGNINDVFPQLLSPDLWTFQRVPYPASAGLIGPSIEVGVDWVVQQIEQTPIGTPFGLGGYSQGAAVMSRLYNECRYGRLKDRRADLRGMITFGNPMREENHTFVGSSGYSGACDVLGSTSGGHGSFPSVKDVEFAKFLGNDMRYITRFARLEATEDLVWDFHMPNETISGIGGSADGVEMGKIIENSLTLLPLVALAQIGRLNSLWAQYGVAPAGVPQGTDLSAEGYRQVLLTDPVTGEQVYFPGGGHIMYPWFPPPNADGSIPTSGDTCYQLAAKYMNSVGARIYDEMNPTVVAPTSRAALSWFTSLPGE